MLTNAGKAIAPDRTRLQSVLSRAVAGKPERSTLSLSPLSLTFFMNSTSKVLAGLVAVVVVVGGGLYWSSSSNSSNTVADTYGTPSQDQGTMQNQSAPTAPSNAALTVSASDVSSPAVATALNDVSASLQSDQSAQTSAISALDQSTNADVSAADTGSSNSQPYNENSI